MTLLRDAADPALEVALDASPLVHVRRSGRVESIHRGSIAVADAQGRLLAQAGNPSASVFWRSAAKIHQAIPLVLARGVERFRLSSSDLAIICGSHNGEPEQVACVRSILVRLGLGPEALRCGSHEPYGQEAARDLVRRDEEPSTLHNPCSGNHAGLIALNRLLGEAISQYEALDNIAEQRALHTVARFAGLPAEDVFTGIDGCGIPAYQTPLHALATAFARLVAPPENWEQALRDATSRTLSALIAQPEFVSGKGELDTEMIRAFDGAGICKLGAEAVCAAAFFPTDRFPDGVGLAIKIEDGMGNRARAVALAACLELGLGTAEQRAAFDRQIERAVRTRRGEMVGDVTPVFRLRPFPVQP